MNKSVSIVLVIILGLITFLALRTQVRVTEPSRTTISATNVLRVSVSFYPIADFVKQVGGNYVQVETVVPVSKEPHNFEPTAQDIINIYKSKLFIYNGGDVDLWAFRLDNGLKSKGINTTNLLTKIGFSELNDPHAWLDPLLAQKEVLAIRDALLTADPDHDTQYRLNAYNLNRKLSQLNQSYTTGLARCTNHELNTMHQGFSYLASRYSIQLTHRGTAIELNPIETITRGEQLQGKNYISLMQDNLKTLRTTLVCH